jgi:poly-gamma-glutamate capsule biosynthesis protein CapA/YwtB (metallophosphatase superfamily)
MVTPDMIMGASIHGVSDIETYEEEQRTIQVLASDWEHVG